MIVYCLSFDENDCPKDCTFYKNCGGSTFNEDGYWENWQNFHKGKLLGIDIMEVTCVGKRKAIAIKDNKLKYNMMKILKKGRK